MDSVRVAIAAMGRLLFSQFIELMLEMGNNGLTRNLACGSNFALNFGLKGADIAMASYLSELLYLANPVTTLMQSVEQHIQDMNLVCLIFAQKTAEAIHILKMMLDSMIVALYDGPTPL
ncbi:hypothetical protein L7F22_034707 [Adiantum nelumboides]|nr:hypothetical protein [Adiantum nelumboides]